MFDFFYGQQSELFSFYRVPKVLFTHPDFRHISTDAKVLYGILLDRMGLSAKMGWHDEFGRVYIIFTVDEMMEMMGCGNQKIGKMMTELERGCGLIQRKRQGLGKPNLIYVKNFTAQTCENHTSGDVTSQTCENHTSGDVEITPQEVCKSHGINTDISNTDISDTDIFPSLPSSPPPGGRMETNGSEGMSRMDIENARALIQDRIGYSVLPDYGFSQDLLDEIVELLAEMVAIPRTTVRISGTDFPYRMVRDRLLGLNMSHIQYVLDCMSQNTTQVRNAKQYLLTVLFNAPTTMEAHLMSQVQHDRCS